MSGAPAPASAPPGDDGIAHFVGKWLAHSPEMQIARVFCGASMRPRFDAWGALLHELQSARVASSDANVAGAKTAWWSDELRALGEGAPRHPLARALQGIEAPWLPLARAVAIEAGAVPAHPGDTAESLAQIAELARAVSRVEAALFGRADPDDAARAVAVHWRLHALPRGLAHEDAAGLPMSLLARHALTRERLADTLPAALLRDWAAELRAALPETVAGAALPAQARLRFDRRRLERLAARGDVFDAGAGPGLLWQAWRAGQAAQAGAAAAP